LKEFYGTMGLTTALICITKTIRQDLLKAVWKIIIFNGIHRFFKKASLKLSIDWIDRIRGFNILSGNHSFYKMVYLLDIIVLYTAFHKSCLHKNLLSCSSDLNKDILSKIG
jgi:hypothetical protein